MKQNRIWKLMTVIFVLFLMILSLEINAGEMESKTLPEDILKLIKSTGGVREYPDADTVQIFNRTVIDYQENGDYTTQEYCLAKILTENGKKSYSTIDFPYHKRYQDVSIPLAMVIFPDGSFSSIPKDAITDATETETQSMNIFEESFRRKTITVPDLQTGCLVLYKSITKTQSLLKNNFADEFLFQGTDPILERTVIITGPAIKPLKAFVVNGTISFNEKKDKDKITYKWQATNVPMIITEPGMVPVTDVATKLLVSTFTSWKELSIYGDSLNADKIDINDEMKKTVKKLTANCSTDEQKILAIFRFICQKIRYMGSSMDVGAFVEPHKATYTFEKQYGICRDKSVLMASMLKEIGIECYDVLINVNINTIPEIPTIFFQHAICAVVMKDGRIVYMDPTLEISSSFGETYTGDQYTLFLSKKGEDLTKAPPVPAERSMGKVESHTKLMADGTLTGDIKVSGSGYYDLVLRSVNQSCPAIQFNRLLSRLGTRFHPKTIVSNVKTTNPVDLNIPYFFSFDFNIKDYSIPAGNFLLFNLPLSTNAFDIIADNIFTDLTKLKSRKFPIGLFSSRGCEQYDTMTVPEGYRVYSIPQPVCIKQGPISLLIETKIDGSNIVFHSDYRIEKSRLSPEEYQDLRKVATAMKKYKRNFVILEKIKS